MDSKVFSPSNFIELKNFKSKKSKVQKYESKKFWVQNFCQENCGYKEFKSEKNLVQKNLGPKKIGSVKGEILLIWTNVARTYVALSNVTITVGIC